MMKNHDPEKSVSCGVQSGWWQDFFAGLWPEVQRASKAPEQTRTDVDFIEHTLGLKPGSRVLDIPCGLGRHSIELAKRGYSVMGVDLQPVLLDKARRATRAEGLNVRFRQGDMRSYRAREPYDAVICMWGSLGYFEDADNLRFLRNCFANLKPGGGLIVDTPVLDTFLAGMLLSPIWREVDDLYILERKSWNALQCRMETSWTFIKDGHTETRESSLRIYTLQELLMLLHNIGFTDIRPYGSPNMDEFGMGRRLYLAALR